MSSIVIESGTIPKQTISGRATRKRVRTGCLCCRRRHKKCDETRPVCDACTQRNERCEWPICNRNKRHKVPTITTPTSAYTKVVQEPSQPTNQTPGATLPKSTPIVTLVPENVPIQTISSTTNLIALDQYSKNLESMAGTSTATRERADFDVPGLVDELKDLSHMTLFRPQQALAVNSSSPESSRTSITNGKSPTESPSDGEIELNETHFPFNLNSNATESGVLNYTDLQTTFRDYMFANASNYGTLDLELDMNNIFTAANSPTSMGHNRNSNRLLMDISGTSPSENIPFLTQSEEKQLMKNYLYKVAPWLDMFDLSRQFGLQSVQLAKTHLGLRYAIYALSSRQQERINPLYPVSNTMVLYQSSLKHLIPTVKKTPDLATITACVILCVFEMMSISPEKWRYHLEGCSALFKASGINGFSDMYERALFWCFARMDVNSAVIGEEKTMIESEKWLPPGVSIYDAPEHFRKEKSIDMYANYSVFLCSRVLNLISTSEIRNFDQEWEILWNEVIDWHNNRPEQMKPILKFESSPFPEILYDNGSAISANQLYHMAMILLMENKPRLMKFKSKEIKPSAWHAKQICAISLNNDHHGCWNNSVQTLYIAGRLLTHKDEHEIILELLNKIETTTGWAMNFRAQDLKDHWKNL